MQPLFIFPIIWDNLGQKIQTISDTMEPSLMIQSLDSESSAWAEALPPFPHAYPMTLGHWLECFIHELSYLYRKKTVVKNSVGSGSKAHFEEAQPE